MNDNVDRLTETFEAHEHLAPNPAVVLERAALRARSYRRRRRAAQATGASVLGAGLVAGGVALPGLKSHQGGGSVSQSLAGIATPIGSPSGTPSPVPSAIPSVIPSALASTLPSPVPSVPGSPGAYTEQQEIDAFIADGYDYNNATDLAKLWNETDVTKVKADAGLKLLTGAALPVTPNGTPETQAQKDMDAYFNAGYDYNDAMQLSSLWHQTDISQVKADAGQKLLAGQTLPIAPSNSTSAVPSASSGAFDNPADAASLAAYFAAGYDYDNAVTLSGLWHETDIAQVKAEAGQKLLAGQPLPIAPAASASPSAS